MRFFTKTNIITIFKQLNMETIVKQNFIIIFLIIAYFYKFQNSNKIYLYIFNFIIYFNLHKKLSKAATETRLFGR